MFAEGKSPVHLAAPAAVVKACAMSATTKKLTGQRLWIASCPAGCFLTTKSAAPLCAYRRSHELRQPLDDAGAWQM